MNRRTFFQRATVAAGAALAPSILTRQASAAGPALKLGLASYSLRKLKVDEVIAACQEIGVRHITLKDMHLPRTASPEELEATRARFAAAGVEIMGGGVINMKNDEAQVRKDFEYARAAKLPLIVASPTPDALDLVERMIKEFGISVAIHNHGPEDATGFASPRDIIAQIKKRDRRLGVCMDIGHTVRAGADPIACVAACGPRLLDLHIKDLKDKTDKKSQTEVGKGAIDVAGLLKVLARRRFAGHVALEYEINESAPLPGIRESLAYLRGVVAGLGA